MNDREGNKITPVNTPNGHWLIWGQSGQGKTYEICRKIERGSEKFLIIDNSGSYTKPELIKNRFEKMRQVKEINPYIEECCWTFYAETVDEAAHVISDALVKITSMGSYFQKRLLQDAVHKLLTDLGEFSFPFFMDIINDMMHDQKVEDGGKDIIENLVRLLNRFAVFEDIEQLTFRWSKEISLDIRKPILILQLSDFPDQQRKFLSELFLQLIWREAKKKNRAKFDCLILDEFQNFSVKPQSAVNQMLREGRKYGLSLIMSSQIISGYSREELEVLMQAGHFLIFKPTAKDLKASAQIVDFENQKSWQSIMKGLTVGEAVLTGRYKINEREHQCSKPILIKTHTGKALGNMDKKKK